MADTTENKPAEKKAAAPKKAAAKPAAAGDGAKQRPAAAKATAKKTASKAASDKPTVTVTQIGSPIGRQGWQRQVLVGLGLNKMHRTRQLEDTPAVRGMIDKIKHLVRVESQG